VDVRALEAVAGAGPDLDLGTRLDAVRAAVAGAGSTTPAGRVAVTSALGDLVTQVGNTSKLILDPDLDSFYVMDALVVQVPRLLLASAQAAAPDEAAGSDDLVAAQAVRAGAVSAAARGLRGDVGTATTSTSDRALAARLAGLTALADTADTLAARVTDDLTRRTGIDPAPVAEAAVDAYGPAADGLDALLEARVGGLAANRAEGLVLTVAGLLLALWFAAGVWWRTRADVSRALRAVTAMADGDRTRHPLPSGRDELGDLGRAVATTRVRLAEQADQLVAAQRTREEELRTRMEGQAAAERQVRDRAQDFIDETADSVTNELREVVAQVAAVRAGAATTGRSTVEITATVSRLREQAELMARSIGEMGAGIGSVDEATAVLSSVAADQHEVVGRLDASISGAIDRVESMSNLTDRLERRRLRRVAVEGPATLRRAAGDVPVRLLDLGEGGVRCFVARPESLERGDTVTFEAVLGGRALRIDASVAHRTRAHDADEVGLQFSDLSQDVADFLRRYVVEHARVDAG